MDCVRTEERGNWLTAAETAIKMEMNTETVPTKWRFGDGRLCSVRRVLSSALRYSRRSPRLTTVNRLSSLEMNCLAEEGKKNCWHRTHVIAGGRVIFDDRYRTLSRWTECFRTVKRHGTGGNHRTWRCFPVRKSRDIQCGRRRTKPTVSQHASVQRVSINCGEVWQWWCCVYWKAHSGSNTAGICWIWWSQNTCIAKPFSVLRWGSIITAAEDPLFLQWAKSHEPIYRWSDLGGPALS